MISSSQLASQSIGSSKLGLGSVGSGQLQQGSVGSLQIKEAAIGTAHIQNAAITTAAIEDAAITDAKIGSLSADKITSGTITADKLLITESASVAGKDIISAINEVSEEAQHAQELNRSRVIGYLRNDALNITDTGMELYTDGEMTIESGAKLAIKSGGEFSVTSPNFTVEESGTVTMKNAEVSGYLTNGGNDVLTDYDVIVSDTKPTYGREGSIWVKPATQTLVARAKQEIMQNI